MCLNRKSKAAAEQARNAQIMIQQQQQALAAAEADRKVMQEKANELQAQQLEFNKRQQAFAEEQARKNDEIANRPPPPPAAMTVPDQQTGDAPTNAAGEQDPLRKKGRASLRIDMSGAQKAGATGLNISRG